MSASDSSRAHRIAKRLKNHQKITREEREFLLDWRRLRSRRGKAAPDVVIPAPEECEDAPSGEVAAASPPAEGEGPPPLSVDLGEPAPSSTQPPPADAPGAAPNAPSSTPNAPSSTPAKPAATAKPEKKPHIKTAVGEQARDLYIQALSTWNEGIKAKGGTPCPEPLIKIGSLSAQWLADEYLGSVMGDSEAMHWLNGGMPVAWCAWFGRKGAKPADVDQGDAPELRTIDDVAKKHTDPKPDESPKPPNAAPPKAPTVKEAIVGDKARDAVLRAVGVGGDAPP